MIKQGSPLEQADLVEAYAKLNDCACLYYDLRKYNNLDATKKATVTTYYEEFVDEYVMDCIKQGDYNILSFDTEDAASVNAGSWFPKKSLCPDDDHFINAYVINNKGSITWQNV